MAIGLVFGQPAPQVFERSVAQPTVIVSQVAGRETRPAAGTLLAASALRVPTARRSNYRLRELPEALDQLATEGEPPQPVSRAMAPLERGDAAAARLEGFPSRRGLGAS